MTDEKISERLSEARRRTLRLAKIVDDRRLNSYNEQVAEEILLAMSKGVSFIELQKLGTIPIDCNPNDWAMLIPEFALEYAKAEKLFADCIVMDALLQSKLAGDLREYNGMVKWLAPKLHPQKYSDRYVHVEDGNLDNYSEEELEEAAKKLEDSVRAEFEAKFKKEIEESEKKTKKKKVVKKETEDEL